MTNAHDTLINLWELDRKLYIFYVDPSMGRWIFVRASRFWKVPAQLAGIIFGQSFTPDI